MTMPSDRELLQKCRVILQVLCRNNADEYICEPLLEKIDAALSRPAQDGERKIISRVKLVYNKETKTIDKVRQIDGLVLESFNTPEDNPPQPAPAKINAEQLVGEETTWEGTTTNRYFFYKGFKRRLIVDHTI